MTLNNFHFRTTYVLSYITEAPIPSALPTVLRFEKM